MNYLKKLGLTLTVANAPDHFLKDASTAVLIRQVRGVWPSPRRPA